MVGHVPSYLWLLAALCSAYAALPAEPLPAAGVRAGAADAARDSAAARRQRHSHLRRQLPVHDNPGEPQVILQAARDLWPSPGPLDSLVANRFAIALERRLGMRVPLRAILESQTPEQLVLALMAIQEGPGVCQPFAAPGRSIQAQAQLVVVFTGAHGVHAGAGRRQRCLPCGVWLATQGRAQCRGPRLGNRRTIRAP